MPCSATTGPQLLVRQTMRSELLLLLLIGAAPACLCGQVRTAPELRLADTELFESAGHPQVRVSQIGELTGAMLMSADRFVFVDGTSQELVFVTVAGNAVEWTGRKGDGPREFRSVRLLTQTATGGLVVWDADHRRLSAVDYLNEKWVVGDLRGYDRSVLRGGMLTEPAAVYEDGALVFRASVSPRSSVFEMAARETGFYRDTLQYWLAVPGEVRQLVVQGLGSEGFSSVSPTGTGATMGVIFGHSLLHTQVGQQLAVSQTDLGTVRVFDRRGKMTAEIPLPLGEVVSQDQIDAVRARHIEADDAIARKISEGQRKDGFDFASMWRNRSEHVRQAPANEIAPPISRMKGDLDGRLWLRLLRPGDTRQHWQVWNLTGPDLEFTLVLAEGETFFDATGDRVLVGARDEFDVDYLLVKEIVR